MLGVGGMNYALTGEQGSRPNTVKARKNAFYQLNEFLKTKNVGLQFQQRDVEFDNKLRKKKRL